MQELNYLGVCFLVVCFSFGGSNLEDVAFHSSTFGGRPDENPPKAKQGGPTSLSADSVGLGAAFGPVNGGKSPTFPMCPTFG